jgi:hypothetical protein
VSGPGQGGSVNNYSGSGAMGVAPQQQQQQRPWQSRFGYATGQMQPGMPRTGGVEPMPNQMAPTIGPNGQPISNAGAGFGNGLQPSGFNYSPQWNGQRLDSMPMGQMPGPIVPQTGLLGQMPGRARYPWQGPAEDYQNGGSDGGSSGGY